MVCTRECSFLTLDKESFSRILGTKTKRQFIHLVDQLRENALLKELSGNTIKALFLIMERLCYGYGNVVYREGDESESLLFVIEGEFKLQRVVGNEVQDVGHSYY